MSKGISAWVWVLGLGPLIGLSLVVGLRTASSDHERLDCLSTDTPVTTQMGTVGRVGQYQLYVVNKRWLRITLGCGGKYRLQCLRESPGIEALEQHVGQPVQVEFCGPHAVGYTVGGLSYRYDQPVAAQAPGLEHSPGR
jgi:hypothetical protein